MADIHKDRILFEDEHLLIVNKLGGELTVAAGGEGKTPLYDFLHKSRPGLRVVHRLDYGTSGVLVFAKSAEVVRDIREKKFAGWKKTYRTLVAGSMDRREGTIRTPLPARTKAELVPAVSHYKALEVFRHASYVEVEIETGRKHQVRLHMKAINHPLLLDPVYGDPRLDRAFKRHHKYRRFFLHAHRLAFPHPVTKEPLTIEAPLPQAFENVLEELRALRS